MYEKKASIEPLLKIKINPTSFTDWEEAYWFAKCLYAQEDYSLDRKVLDAFDVAFYKGLNIESDRDKFLEATQITAKLHFVYKDYVQTSNQLLMLLTDMDEVPVWINFYFAITQVYTNLSLTAEDPDFYLFQYLDVAENDDERIQRNAIFIDFLNILIEKKDSEDLETVALNVIFDKACDYGLNTERTLQYFKDAYGIEKDIPIILPADVLSEKKTVDEEAQKTIIEQNIRIAELEQKVNELEKTISERLDQILAGLKQEELNAVEDVIKNDEVIQAAEASQDSAEAQIETLESQLPTNPIDATYLFRPGQKILVYGGQQSRQDKLVLHAKKRFGLGEKYFEFVLDYDKIKSHASRIHPYSDKYAGILIGESPHMTSGTEDYSSFVVRLETEEGFPFTVRATDEAGKLKMTKTSFGTALWKLINHLMAQAA